MCNLESHCGEVGCAALGGACCNGRNDPGPTADLTTVTATVSPIRAWGTGTQSNPTPEATWERL